jgi:DNA-binding MarR family transcriptional regulator
MNDLPVDSLKLDSQLCFKLYAASRAVIRGYKPMLEQLGLTYPQYLAMLVLWEWQDNTPEQPTVKALGERLLLDSGTLTLVQRQRSARDEREVHLSLSESGKALREQVGPLKARLLCDSGVDLDRLGDLRDGLDHLLAQIKALT